MLHITLIRLQGTSNLRYSWLVQPSTLDLETLEKALIRTVKGLVIPGNGERAELDRSAYAVLGTLVHLGPSRLSDLAHHLQLDLSTVSRQVRLLIDSGHVDRVPDPDDGRASLLSISRIGDEVMRREQARRHRLLDAALGSLNPAERDTLVDLFTRVSTYFAPPAQACRPGAAPAERSS